MYVCVFLCRLHGVLAFARCAVTRTRSNTILGGLLKSKTVSLTGVRQGDGCSGVATNSYRTYFFDKVRVLTVLLRCPPCYRTLCCLHISLPPCPTPSVLRTDSRTSDEGHGLLEAKIRAQAAQDKGYLPFNRLEYMQLMTMITDDVLMR